MNADQPELPGMPPTASLVRSLRRPTPAKLAAQIQVCFAMLSAGSCRSLTASPVLELARTVFGLRFTHDDRWTLAGMANLPVPRFRLPSDLRPSDAEVKGLLPAEAGAAIQTLEKMIARLRHMRGGGDV